MNELKILKRLHHIHCVSLVASYTDPKYFGIIIAPVADCDLAAFYPTVTPETTPILRSFFGCLANAMNFLHSAKIRHRDIKPQNILVKGSSVYLTDFGISLDWENLSRSTTTKDTAKSMLYCAPEVARYEKRNTSADIWSLGCVFLEMLTVIKCKTLEEQRSLFKEQSGNYRFYDNISAIRDWTAQLRRLEPEGGPDSLMSDVILEMLQETADDRILAAILSNKISKYQTSDSTKINPICGDCCNADTFSISDSGSDKDPFEDTS
ncbi:kinase-like protein [Cadophora sp. DSE1049]|nr:kinase-like protein [Cadophora sp. DSE1049]